MMSLVKLCATVFLLMFLSSCATQAPQEFSADTKFTIADLKKRAELSNYAGNHSRALVDYQKILEQEPDNVAALNGAGVSLLAANQPQRSLIYFERVLELQKTNETAREGRALSWLMQGNYAAAQKSLLNLVDDGVNRWQTWNGLGVIADMFGDYSDATGYYRNALMLEPSRAMLHNNLGYSYLMAHEYIQAEATLRKGMLLEPGNQLMTNNLAMSVAWQGRYKEAIEQLSTIMDAAAANNNVGYIAYLRNDYETAKELFAAALRLRPTYYKKAANNLAMVQRKLAKQ